ncbi:putative nucleolar rna methyltransferase [Phaeomoniella chlamydospora]|uniref:NOL1/NOP2/Sun domain family member 4 n=1 Tax=Phaeomoniella chlamydospora TaxID=158046 RepID=A0A0G2ERZ9_PHACM|nr:putative nucleolar rna methyltransferase [Phaeomoniella chlamydospora]
MRSAMPTKAERKQLEGAVSAFHSHYASSRNWGAERWDNTLYQALAQPTCYALLVNLFAPRSRLEDLLRKSQIPTSQLRQVKLPVLNLPKLEVPLSQLILYEHLSQNDSESANEKTESTDQELEAKFLFPPPAPIPSRADRSKSLLSHWNMDAASGLAAYMLAVRPGDRVLDLCAAPGGKSVSLAQLLFPQKHADFHLPTGDGTQANAPVTGCLHSNEVDVSRNKRLAANLRSYIPGCLFEEGHVKVLRLDGTDSKALQQLPLGPGGYDKVLLDAPCSSERHIIHAYDKASSVGRIAEEMARWRPGSSRNLAKVQAALLMTALRAARTGGRVVYSTCSIESGENDGVIRKVLDLLEKERRKYGLKWKLQFGTETDEALDKLTEVTEFGRIALPDHKSGAKWGPLYFCVITKIGA